MRSYSKMETKQVTISGLLEFSSVLQYSQLEHTELNEWIDYVAERLRRVILELNVSDKLPAEIGQLKLHEHTIDIPIDDVSES